MTDSCCCMAETNAILWRNYPPIKIFKNKLIRLGQKKDKGNL